MGTNMTRECRAWNGFYSVVWSDFPEVSGLLEQIIAHAAALEPIFAERLRALPYLPRDRDPSQAPWEGVGRAQKNPGSPAMGTAGPAQA
jgi:hypothetical protein